MIVLFHSYRPGSSLLFPTRAIARAVNATIKRAIPIQKVTRLPMLISKRLTPNGTQNTTQEIEAPTKYSTMPNAIKANPPVNTIFISRHYTINQPRLYLTIRCKYTSKHTCKYQADSTIKYRANIFANELFTTKNQKLLSGIDHSQPAPFCEGENPMFW